MEGHEEQLKENKENNHSKKVREKLGVLSVTSMILHLNEGLHKFLSTNLVLYIPVCRSS